MQERWRITASAPIRLARGPAGGAAASGSRQYFDFGNQAL